jgi:branched-chain amino acid transport system substrate-binding protein
VPLGKIDAGAVVEAMLESKPDAIFSSLFGADLARFVREGELRGLFKGGRCSICSAASPNTSIR